MELKNFNISKRVVYSMDVRRSHRHKIFLRRQPKKQQWILGNETSDPYEMENNVRVEMDTIYVSIVHIQHRSPVHCDAF